MPRPNLNPLNIGSVARGAAVELFEKCMAKISDNIADTATDATASREITITFKFKPDEDRRRILITTRAKTKLAAIADHASTAYLGKDGDGHTYVFDQDPRQDILFVPPAPEKNLLEFGNGAKQ